MMTCSSSMVAFGIPTIIFVLASCIKAEIIAVNSLNRTDTFFDMEFKVIEEIEGVIVVAEPENACSSIAGPSAHLPTTLNCFVLIKGDPSKCYFDIQMKHALEAGYSAAVIYYTTTETINGIPTLDWRNVGTVNITSVLISEASGNIIKTYYLYTNDPESRLFIQQNAILLYSLALVFGLIAGLCAILGLLFVVCRWVGHHWHRFERRITLRFLKKLKTIKYTKGCPYDTCAICLDEYKEKDTLRVLPCSHAYHRKCIDPWLLSNHKTCPVCKQVIDIGDAQCDNDSSSHTEGIAETSPLLQTSPGDFQRGSGHGTFANAPISVLAASGSYQTDSGAGTSRDVPTGITRPSAGISERLRLCSSAPTVLMVASDGYNSPDDEQLTPHAIATAFKEGCDEISPSNSLNEGKPWSIV